MSQLKQLRQMLSEKLTIRFRSRSKSRPSSRPTSSLKSRLVGGLIFALPPLLSVGVDSLLALKVTEDEIRTNIQQAIGDTSVMVSAYLRREFEHIVRETQKDAEILLTNVNPMDFKGAKNPFILNVEKPLSKIIPVDLFSEVHDLSIWRRVPSGNSDNTMTLQRYFLGLNRRFITQGLDESKPILEVEEEERKFIQAAFQGRTVVALAPGNLGSQRYGIVAAAMPKGNLTDVVAVHIQLRGLESNMPKNGMIATALVDDAGKVLIPTSKESLPPAGSLPGLSSILREMKLSQLMSGQFNFSENEERYFGGYHRIGLGQGTVVASLAESEGTVSLQLLRVQLLGLWVISFFIFFTMGYRLSPYIRGRPKVLNSEKSSDKKATSDPGTGSHEKKLQRWLINNGSQILGPFVAEEIAPRLFAQELDFDCECWAEGVGISSQIRNSGIFTGSQDQDAKLWLYDGTIIHGPVSPGFLRTAILHGAMPIDVFICEESTVNGWLTLEAWEKATAARNQQTEPTSQEQPILQPLLGSSLDSQTLQASDLPRDPDFSSLNEVQDAEVKRAA